MAINTTKIYFFNLFCRIAPPTHFQKFKIRLLRWAGAKVGKNVSIFDPRILGPIELIIGDNCWIGHEALIMGMAGSKVEMKRGSKLGTRALLVTGYHKPHIEEKINEDDGVFGNITLERGCGVDTMAMVCPGKTIGARAHVTACSIVRHNVPPYAMVMGSPAKVVGFRFSPSEIIEYEKKNYPEEDRVSPELIEKNYKKYFLSRSKELQSYVKL